MRRRKFLTRTLWSLFGLGTMSGLYTWQIEPFWLEFVKLKMPIKNLPKQLVGKTVMQISDFHVGNKFDYNYIIDSLKKAKEYNPDFVVYTGDYISYENEKQFDQLAEVLKYSVKGKLGTVGVLGNHDYGNNWGEQRVANKVNYRLEQAGITILKNQQKEINGLNFIGLEHYWGPNFDPSKVMNQYNPSKSNIVLCHNPDVCDLNIWNGYSGWILSGHTHGGQCKPPFLKAPILPVKNKKYNAGKIDLDGDRTLYINRALGHLIQVRFNVRPEITIFELEQA